MLVGSSFCRVARTLQLFLLSVLAGLVLLGVATAVFDDVSEQSCFTWNAQGAVQLPRRSLATQKATN